MIRVPKKHAAAVIDWLNKEVAPNQPYRVPDIERTEASRKNPYYVSIPIDQPLRGLAWSMVVDWDSIEQRFPWECRTYHPHEAVVPWLKANVGEFDGQWYRYGSDIAQGIIAGMPLYDVYRFRDEQAAILFRLRW